MPDKPAKKETRRFDRDPCQTELSYSLVSSAGAAIEDYCPARIRNLSLGGVCIWVIENITVPVMLRIKIFIPGTSRTLLLMGKAVRCQLLPEKGLNEVGVKFVGTLPAEFKDLIDRASPADSLQELQ